MDEERAPQSRGTLLAWALVIAAAFTAVVDIGMIVWGWADLAPYAAGLFVLVFAAAFSSLLGSSRVVPALIGFALSFFLVSVIVGACALILSLPLFFAPLAGLVVGVPVAVMWTVFAVGLRLAPIPRDVLGFLLVAICVPWLYVLATHDPGGVALPAVVLAGAFVALAHAERRRVSDEWRGRRVLRIGVMISMPVGGLVAAFTSRTVAADEVPYEWRLEAHAVSGLSKAPVRDLVARNGGACVVTDDVRCWGGNFGRFPGRTDEHRDTRASKGLEHVRHLGIGGASGCALFDGKSGLTCWVRDSNPKRATAPFPMNGAPPLRDFIVDDDNVIFGIGGDGALWTSPVMIDPQFVRKDAGPIVAVSSGGKHMCAVAENGDVRCSGENRSAESTGADAGYEPADAQVPLPGPAASVACGREVTYATLRDGSVYRWGSRYGIDSDRSTTLSRLPLPEPVVEIVPEYLFGCARAKSGRVLCWGRWRRPDVSEPTTPPEYVPGVEGVDHLAGDERGICASSGARVTCWGYF